MVTIAIVNRLPFSDEDTGHREFKYSVQGHTAEVWTQESWLHSPAPNHELEEGECG